MRRRDSDIPDEMGVSKTYSEVILNSFQNRIVLKFKNLQILKQVQDNVNKTFRTASLALLLAFTEIFQNTFIEESSPS